MDKLKKLEVKRVLNEYSLTKINEEYMLELISANTQEFLKEISEALGEEPQKAPEEEPEEKPAPKKEEIYNLDAFTESTKQKMKKIYREIVKLTHPDKIDSEKLNNLYIEAKTAYYHNDIMELFYIATSLDIDVEVENDDLETFKNIIEDKRKRAKLLESSFLWLWIQAVTPEMKKKIVNFFIEKNYKKKN
jgi:hypothetical protein